MSVASMAAHATAHLVCARTLSRGAIAVAAALLLPGCGGGAQVPPPVVAEAFAREVADIDQDLAGVVRVLPDADQASRLHVQRLWSRAVRADVELRRRLELTARGGRTLRSAAREARAAAHALDDALKTGAPPPSARELDESAAALRAAFVPP